MSGPGCDQQLPINHSWMQFHEPVITAACRACLIGGRNFQGYKASYFQLNKRPPGYSAGQHQLQISRV